jgi:hypothetical protein
MIGKLDYSNHTPYSAIHNELTAMTQFKEIEMNFLIMLAAWIMCLIAVSLVIYGVFFKEDKPQTSISVRLYYGKL